MKQLVSEARRGFWHLRKGGVAQYREWLKRRRFHDATPARRTGEQWNPLGVETYISLSRPKSFDTIKVAVILDDFSMQAWSYEFNTVPVTPENWRELIDDDVDLLLVESAWNGNDGSWQYQLTGRSAPSNALRELTDFCKQRGVPSVFWNKEDPPHFDDFLGTAKLFDVVFTTDVNKVSDYRKALDHDRIHVMSFAAQPAIHNPIRLPGIHQRGDIAFAGMYFAHKFPERRQQMQVLLSAAAEVSSRMNYGLTIFSRFAGNDEKYQFPAPFDQYVVGSLPYAKMLTAYRHFKVFLNVNSVTDSSSMCARRIFEITASGTPVVSAPSAAIRNFFPADEVPTVDDEVEAALLLRSLVNSAQYRDRMVHKAQRRIWGAHTYTHRAEQVLAAAGIAHRTLDSPTVSIVVSTNRPDQIEHVLSQIVHQRDVKLEVLLLSHGFDLDESELRETCQRLGIDKIRSFSAPAAWSLGACLNKLVSEARGSVVAKFDDDDLYGPFYLLDQLNALSFSGADLVGKEAAYAYLESNDVLVLRRPTREHRWTDFIAGPTLVGYRRVFEEIPFADITHGEDSAFLVDVLDAGMKIYAADRFNFIQVRGHGAHTWSATDAEFLANGIVESFGLNTRHVCV
ncbi:glycosyltransferase family protein [Corynebacterium halotolerans]|uniref:glycosyltransferase family protein n=1 Tax=Corynebacterium halotolerans TaxID=225326 RepID=UPI003CF0CBAA